MSTHSSDASRARVTPDAPNSTARRSPSSSSASQKRRRSVRSESGERSSSPSQHSETASNPPLPDEEAPPLPEEAPPVDDGWDAMWDNNAQAYYFYNRYTQMSQWENPRVPSATTAANYGSFLQNAAPGTASSSGAPGTSSPPRRRAGGYNPAIHGNYDPTADYALEAQREEEAEETAAATAAGLPDPNADYAATGRFNRFTGRFQNDTLNPEKHNDENKSKRQMGAFFDVDAAANSHDGRSLKAERRGKSLSKKELKAYKDKRREKKEEKRRAWLRD